MGSDGGTPLREVAGLLHGLRLPAAARQRPAQTLTAAAVTGDVDLVRAFLAAGSSLEERTIGFTSPLLAAAGRGRLAVVEFLLGEGANPRERPGEVYSPLGAAAMHGHLDVVRRLAEVIGDLAGETKAAYLAAINGREDCLEILLARGAPLDERGRRARERCLEETAERASQATGPSRVPRAPRGARRDDPPLEGSARGRAIERVVERIQSGALRGRLDDRVEGRPLLVHAAEGGHLPIVQALLEAGASPHVTADDADTGLIAAARWGHAAVVASLIRAGADLDARNADRQTALMVAAGRGDLECVRLLLDAGADPDARLKGRSARGYAYGLHKQAIREVVEMHSARRKP